MTKTTGARTSPSKPAGEIRRRLPAAARRRQIAEVALDLIAENGVIGTSAAGIAAAAGVSEAALYHHFGSRKKVLEAALDLVFEELRREVLAPTGANAIERLRRIDDVHSRAIAGQKRIFAALFQFYAAPAKGGLTVEVRERELAMISALASVVETGKAEGVIREDVDPQSTAWMLTAVYWLKDVSRLVDLENMVLSGPSQELLHGIIASIATDGDGGRARG